MYNRWLYVERLLSLKKKIIPHWKTAAIALFFLIVLLLLHFGESKSVDFLLGGILAIIGGFFGAHHSGVLQEKRDNALRIQRIYNVRVALLSELTNLWETYMEQAGHKLQEHDQMKNPYSPPRGYVPPLRHCPILQGVAQDSGLLNIQELNWVHRTYATLAQLEDGFVQVENRRKDKERMPMGQGIRNYENVLFQLEKDSRMNLHALDSGARLFINTTKKLLERPLDASGNPVGPGPFEDEQLHKIEPATGPRSETSEHVG